MLRRTGGEPEALVCNGSFEIVAQRFYGLCSKDQRCHILRSDGGLMWTASDLVDNNEFHSLQGQPVVGAIPA